MIISRGEKKQREIETSVWEITCRCRLYCYALHHGVTASVLLRHLGNKGVDTTHYLTLQVKTYKHTQHTMFDIPNKRECEWCYDLTKLSNSSACVESFALV